ncbi:Uma2 family endonuclease [Nannocystis sp. ILAH1]|uniref:Uma2 family endonuclease n=1 Tax=unclassified Nannocystis TaxID=2627009 RepID=UPI0022716802|nr:MULTISPECIES: Uma2 family endonuclease [unclassified Nannocystis]MCY0985507.1 Uma2 family endonuclease [Nannocystis sp. ILAH1]MCY1068193.1 Uma2 family endonuclease [Nannocystis sp. RBIL2]
MGEPQRKLPDPLTVDEFLAITWPEGARHELHDGHVVAMAPPMRAHHSLVTTLSHAIGPILEDCCEVLTEAGVVPSLRRHTYYQVDLLVTCEPPEPRQRTIRAPLLLVEVLSPSTQAIDRNRKLPDYRQLASVQEVVLIDSEAMHVELYRRFEGIRWLSEILRDPTDVLHLDSVGLDLALDDLYRRVVFPAEEAAG